MNITLPKGTYYLGDPKHVLEDKDYIGIWGNYYKHALGHIQINVFDFASYSTQMATELIMTHVIDYIMLKQELLL